MEGRHYDKVHVAVTQGSSLTAEWEAGQFSSEKDTWLPKRLIGESQGKREELAEGSSEILGVEESKVQMSAPPLVKSCVPGQVAWYLGLHRLICELGTSVVS